MMKNTMKKFLALLLTVVMTASMFVVGTGAVELNAAETFTGAELDDKDNLTTTSGWYGVRETSTTDVEVALTDGAFVWTPGANGTNYQLKAPDTLVGNYYTLTAELTISGVLTGNTSVNYSQITFGINNGGDANTTLGSNNLRIMVYPNNTEDAAKDAQVILQAVCGGQVDKAATYNLTTEEIARALENTVTVTFARNGISATLTISDANGVIASTTTYEFHGEALVPGIRLQSGGADGEVYTIDNLDWQMTGEDLSEKVWSATTQNFDSVTMNGNYFNNNGWVSTNEGSTPDVTANKVDGALALKGNPTSSAASVYLLDVPSTFTDKTWTFTGELNFSNYVADQYARVFIRAQGSSNNAVTIHISSSDVQVGFMNETAGNWGEKRTFTDKYMGTDVQFMLVREGRELTFSIWEKDNYSNTVETFSRFIVVDGSGVNYENYRTATPDIRVQYAKGLTATETNPIPTITIDDLRLENIASDVNLIGAQASVETAEAALSETKTQFEDNTYAVRFVGTIDSLAYSNAGFRVVASAPDGTVLKSWTLDTCTALKSIVGMTENGTVDYTAQELGGNYLIALTVTGIPKTEAANVIFQVQAFTTSVDGEYVYNSTIGTCTATVAADGTVSLA